jgi:hypothetical protein
VNSYDQIIKQIIATSPSWENDGGGIRGRTIAPILSGLSPSGVGDFAPQIFNQQNNETVQRSAGDPISDLTLDGGGAVGGGDSCVGLALYIKTVGTPPNTTQQVWVGAGTVAGQVPSGFDPADGKSIANSGSGDVWAEVNIDVSNGNITSVAVNGGGSTPQNTDSSFYISLGSYSYTNGTPRVSNFGCGSVYATICRIPFRSQAPFYKAALWR